MEHEGQQGQKVQMESQGLMVSQSPAQRVIRVTLEQWAKTASKESQLSMPKSLQMTTWY